MYRWLGVCVLGLGEQNGDGAAAAGGGGGANTVSNADNDGGLCVPVCVCVFWVCELGRGVTE